jgi:hypothetical protein
MFDRRREPARRCVMADVIYVVLTLVFFGLTWLLVKLCERV